MPHPIEATPLADTIIVVPCFNEARRLDVEAFSAFLDTAREILLLLVDDGSTDDTFRVLEQLRQRHPRHVSTLRLATNSGKAEAVRRGIQLALRRRPAIVGYWDADLATPLDAIGQLRAVLHQRSNTVLVMGSRVPLLGRHIRRGRTRKMLGRAFAAAASLLLRIPVYDTQCGAKLFRVTPATTKLFDRPFRSRWIFDVEILARLLATKRLDRQTSLAELIYEQPLDCWQDVRGSRVKLRDFAKAAFDLATIYWRYTLRSHIDTAGNISSEGAAAETAGAHRDAA